MDIDRLQEAKNSLNFWQEKLSLQDWSLSVELTQFNRTDYIQTGDFKVVEDKKAIIYISEKPTDKDLHKVVLHELIHVLLWKMDSYCEQNIGPKNRDQYMELLETTVEDLTNKIYLSCEK